MTNATHSSLARLYRCAVCDRRRRIQWTRVEMRLYAGQPGRDETVSCGSAIRSHKRPSLCVGRGPGGTKRAGLASAPAASCEVDRTDQLHVVVGRVCMCTCGNLLLRSSHRYSHKVNSGPSPENDMRAESIKRLEKSPHRLNASKSTRSPPEEGESSGAACKGAGSVAFACKREATQIKRKLLVPIAAGMVTA